MYRFLLRRIFASIPVVLAVATLVFIVLRLAPGDPALVLLGDFATEERVQALHEKFGLDQPLHVQYLRFLQTLVTGDLGDSYLYNKPVLGEIVRVAPYSIVLGCLAVLLAVAVGVPLGIISAVRRDSWLDHLTLTAALLLVSVPNFYLGIFLLGLFSVRLGWFPTIGGGDAASLASLLWHAILPALTLSGSLLAFMARVTRANILEVLDEDYIRTARAKGLAERVVTYKHALRNALIPVLAILGINVGSILGGSIIIEVVFSRPGLGKLLVDAITGRDYVQVQASILVLAVSFVLVNLLVDLAYAFADPRIKYH